MARAAMKDPITGASLAVKTTKLAAVPAVLKKAAAKVAAPFTPDPKTVARVKAALAEPVAAPAKGGKVKEYVPPKNLAVCADEYYTLRAERLEAEKKADAIKAKESKCREHLINNLPKSEASGISGKVCRVSVENKVVVQVKDWSVETGVWGYVLKNIKKNPGLSGMFQRRVNEGMVKELWDAGKTIPGLDKLEVPTLSVNKL